MLPGCDAQFEQHRKVHLIDETYCIFECFLVFHLDLCGREVHDFDGTLHADTNIHLDTRSTHSENDSLVVRNAGQLDQKHVMILRARVLGAFVACHLASKMIGFGPLSITGGCGQSDHSGKTAFTLHTHTRTIH